MGENADSVAIRRRQHWDRNTLAFLAGHLTPPPTLLRIATGFFSIPGFSQLRPSLDGTTTQILIGFDEDARQKIQDSLIAEIIAELRSWHADRYAIVRQLADDLGKNLRLVHAKARNQDHAKVYIIGARVVIVGSANLSVGGLRHNDEANTAIDAPDDIRFWIREFDARWTHPDTVDITEPLRERLLAWLTLATPWDVYLKAANARLTTGRPHTPSLHYRPPTEYQMVVVRRVVGQLKDPTRRGAIIVASTGLGKTIMATHAALELTRTDVINRVVVFAPAPTKLEWSRRLNTARVHHEVHTIDGLNIERGKVAVMIDAALADADEHTLIVIDESHRFRNRFKGDPESSGKVVRLPFLRLKATTEASSCRVLLLTATPFATSTENINNQLRLLPHTSPTVHPEEGMLGLFDLYPWSIDRVEGMLNLQVATVLNTPFVARHFSRHDPVKNADYLEYPKGGRRYFPSVHLARVEVPLPAEEAVAAALDRRVLRHRYLRLRMYGEYRTGDDVIERLAATAWASSPGTLARTLRDAIDGSHRVDFIVPPSQRERELRPVVQELETIDFESDVKFQAARSIVAKALAGGEKVVLFTERLETAGYLEQGLTAIAGKRIVSAVHRKRGEWVLKDDDRIHAAIRHFAPRSNTPDGEQPPDDQYDVLIATDALAEGINLQDASYLISYDLAWTAVVIIQRAGRVMRLWEQPRTIHLYCFVPASGRAAPPGAVSERYRHRVERLEERLDRASVLTELPLLPSGDNRIERMGSLSSLPLLDIISLEHDLAFAPGLADTTDVLNDYISLQENRAEADAIEDDILSARVMPGLPRPTLITLVRDDQRVVAIRHEAGSAQADEIADDELFTYLRCAREEPTAWVGLDVVEEHRHHAMGAWRRSATPPMDAPIEAIATILLLPREAPQTMVRGSS